MGNTVIIRIICYLWLCCTLGESTSCDTMCLTWKFNSTYLKLVCTVPDLHLQVSILDPNGTEKAYCLIPIPNDSCTSLDKRVEVSQNRKTNETVLFFHDAIDDRVNGFWECKHGSMKHKARVEVTVPNIKKDERLTLANEHCWKNLMLWASLGYVPSFMVVFAVTWISSSIILKESCQRNPLHDVCSLLMKRCCAKTKYITCCLLATWIIFGAVIILIPLVVGIFWKNCQGQEVFVAVGIICGAFSSVCFQAIWKSDKTVEKDSRENTATELLRVQPDDNTANDSNSACAENKTNEEETDKGYKADVDENESGNTPNDSKSACAENKTNEEETDKGNPANDSKSACAENNSDEEETDKADDGKEEEKSFI